MGERDPAVRRLVIGYGNPIRRDDGLGPALAERIDALALPGVTVETDFQLSVEIAHDVARYDEVLFIDAAVTGDAPFTFTHVTEAPTEGFVSHGLSPEGVMYLARTLFASKAEGWLLAIRGYDFTPFDEALSDEAEDHLEEAFRYAASWLRRKKGVRPEGLTPVLKRR